MNFTKAQTRAGALLRTRLDLESLGERVVPAAPVIHNFNASQVGIGQWMLSGTVTDDNPVEGLAVSLVGIGTFLDVKAEVEANGSFCILVDVNQSGFVEATVEDYDSEVSDPARVYLL